MSNSAMISYNLTMPIRHCPRAEPGYFYYYYLGSSLKQQRLKDCAMIRALYSLIGQI